MLLRVIKISFLFIIFLFTANYTHAFSLQNLKIENYLPKQELEIVISPTYPKPNSDVLLEAKLKNSDDSISDIEWVENGEVFEKEKEKIKVHLSEIGTSRNITAIVKTTLGKILFSDITLIPQNVALLIEPETYTPPFYKGRAINSALSKIRLSAIPLLSKPDLTLYKSSELNYIWKKNNTIIKKGVGLSNITIQGPDFAESYIITLEVYKPDNYKPFTTGIILSQHNPKVALYQKKPLLGVDYTEAIKNKSVVRGPDPEIVAEPYFMNVKNKNSETLQYDWSINQKKLKTDIKIPFSITLQPDESIQDKSFILSITVKNISQTLQKAGESVRIQLADALDQIF